MKQIHLFQPQYSLLFNGNKQEWLPYSVGCIWAYALTSEIVKKNFVLQEMHFRREPIEEVVNRMDAPVVAAFSSYVWNEQYNLNMSKLIKEKFPECLIIVGGPQTNEKDLETYPWIDTVVLNEGEKTFTKILEDLHEGNEIKSVYVGSRVTDLRELPSPFTTGVFDKIIRDNPDSTWQTTFETSRGCPFSCTFCDWGSLTYSKVKQFEIERIEEEIKWMAKNPIVYIFAADANFGIFKDRDVELAKMIHRHMNDSMVDKIALQFAKNSNDYVIQIAKELGRLARGITLSAQSMNEQTLVSIKRNNLEINKLSEMIEKAEAENLWTYTELILGLPGETKDTWREGMSKLLEAGQHNSIEIWFAMILKNSEMGKKEYREEHGIQSINTTNYIFLYNDIDNIEEYTEIVSATSTMTTEDIIESFIYSWMIVRLHIQGYTYLLSRYADANGSTYRKFYDLLFDKIPETSIFNNQKEDLELSLKTYFGLYNPTDKDPNEIQKHTHKWMYERNKILDDEKEEILKISEESIKEIFPEIDQSILDCQRDFIYDENIKYPFVGSYKIDLDTFRKTKNFIKYKIYCDDIDPLRKVLEYENRKIKSPTKNTLIKIEEEKYVQEIKLAGE